MTFIRVVGWVGFNSSSSFSILEYKLNGTVADSPFISYFNASSNELILRIRQSEFGFYKVAAGLDHVLQIEIQNGAYGQESPTFFASGEGGALMHPKTILKAAYDAAPLVISGIRASLIGQSNPLASAQNNITITLSFFTFVYGRIDSGTQGTGTMLTISGLEGTQTDNSPSFAIRHNSSFANQGQWSIDGVLVLEVAKTIAPWYVQSTDYSFSFEVVNPALGREPARVSLTATFSNACTSDVAILPTKWQPSRGNMAPLKFSGWNI